MTLAPSPMIPINRTYAPLQALVDELARCGMRHAVTSPGSRNAPLALTLAAQRRIEAMSVLDERSAGFMALGHGQGERPAGGGDVHVGHRRREPAARGGRGPRGARAADRPDRRPPARAARRRRRAGDRPAQALRAAAKWFVEVGNHEPGRDDGRPPPRARPAAPARPPPAGAGPGAPQLPAARAAGARAPRSSTPADWEGRADGRPWVRGARARDAPHADDVQGLAERDRRRAARRDRLRPGGRATWPSPVARAGRRGRLAGARRADVRAALRRARPLPRGRPLRRAAAREALRRARTGPSSCCASATRPRPSRCAPGWRRRRRSCSTPTPPGTSRPAARSWSSKISSAWRVGSCHAASGSSTTCSGVRQPGAQRLGGRHVAYAQHEPGRWA